MIRFQFLGSSAICHIAVILYAVRLRHGFAKDSVTLRTQSFGKQKSRAGDILEKNRRVSSGYVQMPDLDGFGVIENVEPSTGPAPVYVFVTAHDAHAIRAFEVHAVDYLLKPYDKERFAKALVHALQVVEQRGKANRDLEPLLQSLRSLRPLERFVVKDKKRIFFVPVSNVLWIEATGNYACIHTASDSHLLRETLAHLEEKLAPHHFIRVRKSAIVNGACISEIRPMFDGVYDIVLAEGTVVTSSRRYAHKLRTLLET